MIVPGSGPTLLGRNWLKDLSLYINAMVKSLTVNQLEASHSLDEILEKHSDVFSDELGTVKDFRASFKVHPDVSPKFIKARPVPYALKDKVIAELQRLEDEGILRQVTHSDWASPVVPVLKQASGKIRICGDFRTTLNTATITESYPLPRIEDLYATLSGCAIFSVLDLSNAYLQVLLEENSMKYTTINTIKGLYEYTRLPFGASSAPAIFQRLMEDVLKGIPGVGVYLDDVLIAGKDATEHLARLDMVLTVLEKTGIKVGKSKCNFAMPEVKLGHSIDKAGLHTLPEKVSAIVAAPAPTNVTELRSYLGMLQYYARFLPNLSTVIAPLNNLLRKDVDFQWTVTEKNAFEKSKALLCSETVLVHYDQEKPLILACDASPYGLGAVLSHIMEDGTERPVAYASTSLAPAEKRYAQIDKEGLGIIFGVKKFHQYLFGREFTILTDHKPLLGLFGKTSVIPYNASPRVQRWSLSLSAYDYDLVHKPGVDHANADGLSRLPVDEAATTVPTPGDIVLLMEHMDNTTVTAAQIRGKSRHNPVLAKVSQYVMHGWPTTVTEQEIIPYANRKSELTMENDCILWGNRVIVPTELQKAVLQELHECHPGIVRMKALARSYVWWPGVDKDIESMVNECADCQDTRKREPEAPLHPWEWPNEVWSRIHIDYAGPMNGQYILVIVDAHSKYIETHVVNRITSEVTIEKLMNTFATHGLPRTIVSDNGTCFTSQEFKAFTKANGIQHIFSSPYHPASNGLAERAVQTVKFAIKKLHDGSLESKLCRVLARYRITPHSTTGVAPSMLLMKREVRSKMNLIRETTLEKTLRTQTRQKDHHDQTARERSVQIGDCVNVTNFGRGATLLAGTIVEKTGPLTYHIQLTDGRVVRRHIDHLQVRQSPATYPKRNNDLVEVGEPIVPPTQMNEPQQDSVPVTPPSPVVIPEETCTSPKTKPVTVSPVLRRSNRVLKQPQRLDL